MSYRSNSTLVVQPNVWNLNIDSIKNAFTYIKNGLFEKENQPDFITGISNNTSGYNDINAKQLETVYRMTTMRMNALIKNYAEAYRTLDDISILKNNWNNNGAESFSLKLIEKCRRILNELVAEPFICPTACGSIQFEYEKANEEYLEFEIYENRIEVYSETTDNGTKEFCLYGISATDKMKQMVVDFYG